jgi:hypothetical protein
LLTFFPLLHHHFQQKYQLHETKVFWRCENEGRKRRRVKEGGWISQGKMVDFFSSRFLNEKKRKFLFLVKAGGEKIWEKIEYYLKKCYVHQHFFLKYLHIFITYLLFPAQTFHSPSKLHKMDSLP